MSQIFEPFARTEMLPPSEPPVLEKGWIKWARENLFSSPLNAVMTVISLFIAYWLFAAIYPWFANSVWFAGSLTECRAINSGACFAVITERWAQLMFGFYPSQSYWRPTLAFALLIVAIAPVLYSELPRKIIWFTAIYPGLMVWLLWGGSLWGPIMAYAGLVGGWFLIKVVGGKLGVLATAIISALAVLIWWLFFSANAAQFAQSLLPLDIESVESRNFGGFMLSFVVGVTGIALSLPLGILLALGRRSDLFFVRTICIGFIEFIRGVPLITLLLVAATLLNIFLPPGTNFDIILRVIIMVTLFSAAYMAETIRGGLAAISRGQFEAADAMGLDYWQAQRLIVMPQALKVSIPGIVNNFIGLFKDTTLVSIIALLDPLGFAKAIRANADWNGIVWELYGFIAFVFFICCFGMSRYSQYLERKLRTTH